jgi:hypothetical protein
LVCKCSTGTNRFARWSSFYSAAGAV